MKSRKLKLFTVSAMICLNLGLISCSNQVEEELRNYVLMDLPKLAKQESTAINFYNSATGDNYKNDQTSYLLIRDSVIPLFKDYTVKLEEISNNLKTEEVRKVHESYIEAANVEFSAFLNVLTAIEQQDYSRMAEANDKISKSRKIIRDCSSELKILCEKHNIKLNSE
jgi:hypothetical protein